MDSGASRSCISKLLWDSDFAANYLDDIIVFSRTAEEHMLHLEAIFEALQIADLKIKVSKCEFFKKQRNHLMVSVWIVWDHWKDPRGILNGY